MSGTHHGRPGSPTAKKRAALRSIERALPPERLFAAALALAPREEYIARELSCALLRHGLPERRAEVERWMVRLADDRDWEVRECAGGLFADYLAHDFRRALPRLARLARHRSENVRRAVVLAAKIVGKERRREQARALLRLLEPLLEDRSEYVRKNLGPFAIGDGLLRFFPEETLARLAAWARRRGEMTRWNVARALTAASARPFRDRARAILALMEGDERPMVRRAVLAARKKLGLT